MSSFCFLPALLTAGGIVLFAFTQQVDRATQTRVAELPIIFTGGAAESGEQAASTSSSVITVVATVFSVTIVALQLASGQYSSRLLKSFMSDRGVQAVLGRT